jgi:hypothetical protein
MNIGVWTKKRRGIPNEGLTHTVTWNVLDILQEIEGKKIRCQAGMAAYDIG